MFETVLIAWLAWHAIPLLVLVTALLAYPIVLGGVWLSQKRRDAARRRNGGDCSRAWTA